MQKGFGQQSISRTVAQNPSSVVVVQCEASVQQELVGDTIAEDVEMLVHGCVRITVDARTQLNPGGVEHLKSVSLTREVLLLVTHAYAASLVWEATRGLQARQIITSVSSLTEVPQLHAAERFCWDHVVAVNEHELSLREPRSAIEDYSPPLYGEKMLSRSKVSQTDIFRSHAGSLPGDNSYLW